MSAVRAGVAPAYTLEEARTDPAAVSRALRARGVALEPDEAALLPDLLGRAPTWAEAVLFGILWSEHCSYKSTRHLLRRLPTQAPQVILGPGEDAGVIALPAPCEDLALVLAHESHNHPSQVLPVEGAATGVGGIVRDVVCMGAEVIGVLDALRFGGPASGVVARDVTRGVVQGVADYGNALGVPNLGGDVWFDDRFGANCLVNVMAVGVAPRDGILRSRVPADAEPCVFVLVGKPTDESGFGGAAFASEDLGAADADRRGAVQIPDPFLKRVLNVANAEAFARVRARGIPAGFKDLGAGGVACATSEMAAAGGKGAEIALERVHRVAREIAPEVLLCAETQERYCWAVPESFAAELCAIYDSEFALGEIHPNAGARVIGRAIDEPRFRVTWEGEPLVDCTVEAITQGCRVLRPARRRAPASPRKPRRAHPHPREALLALLGSWNGCSREYLFRHYDGEVQARTWLRAGEGDAVVIVPAPDRPLGIAFAVGGNPYWCDADPELGARHAVAEASRNVACVGGRPWALTDCLNFGNPTEPQVMGDVEATIEGLAVAAEALGRLAAAAPLPFVSGNVSLYNQTGARAIPASPIVMCAGVVQNAARAVGLAAHRAGSFLVLVGEPRHEITGSLYLREVLGDRGRSAPPSLDLPREARLQELAVLAAEGGWVLAAHDIAEGGLAMAVAEMLMASPVESALGADLELGPLETTTPLALFSERPGIVFEVPAERAARLYQAARERSLLAWPIGLVTAAPVFRARLPEGAPVEWRVEELRAAAAAPLPRLWNEEIE